MKDSTSQVIKLKVESAYWGAFRGPLFQGPALRDFNEQGREHGLTFEFSENDYDYVVKFVTSHTKNKISWAGGPELFTKITVTAFDAHGKSAFQFYSSSYSIAEIVKRISKLRAG